MQITGERKSKADMLTGLKPGFVSSKLVARNTIKAIYPDGSIIIRYMNTDVVTTNPDKSIILNSDAHQTKTTKSRIEEYTKIRIIQRNSIWYICRNIHQYPDALAFDSMPMYYDGIHISDDGKILSGIKVLPENTIKQFKKDLKKLTEKVTKENIAGYFKDTAGDCLICKFDQQIKKATSDHLISHVKEGYMHGSLIWLCLELSGFNPGAHIRMRFIDNIRRSIRKVISDTCIPVLLVNPELYNDNE